MNRVKLLKLIENMADINNIEITSVNFYPEALDINNKAKICMGSNYVVHKVNEGGGKRCLTVDEMLDEVLELLKPSFNKGDYITKGAQSGLLIKVGVNSYNVLNDDNETIYYYPISLKELEYMGWRKRD